MVEEADARSLLLDVGTSFKPFRFNSHKDHLP